MPEAGLLTTIIAESTSFQIGVVELILPREGNSATVDPIINMTYKGIEVSGVTRLVEKVNMKYHITTRRNRAYLCGCSGSIRVRCTAAGRGKYTSFKVGDIWGVKYCSYRSTKVFGKRVFGVKYGG